MVARFRRLGLELPLWALRWLSLYFAYPSKYGLENTGSMHT